MSTAFGFGIATVAKDESILDTRYLDLGLNPLSQQVAPDLSEYLGEDNWRQISKKQVNIEIETDTPPIDVSDVYLRLQLLSHRIVKPNEINLDGIFGLLNNVVWTSAGPCALSSFNSIAPKLRNHLGHFTIFAIDKFPRMVDYVIPTGVRIADADRVRLGAYLSEGTTVMHEGFVNFNAGTLGKSMVEGRISAGVVIGAGSDVGGGASIMGTLSGGGREVISVGKGSLLGANSGLGISLGDDCIVESGVYITAGSKIRLPDGKIVKARDLSGINNLLFRRNSQSGALEALPKTGSWDGLNSILHSN
jgi:2,3,4,5-tetrahydropyridine-2-carboxylate N-succinyltransferase